MSERRLAVVAVGGNALIRSREASGLDDQYAAVEIGRASCRERV